MKPSDHCERLSKTLRSCGMPNVVVGHAAGDGYFVASHVARSQYGAIGVGSEFPANYLTLREAEAFVAGMCAAVRRIWL